MQSLSRGLAAYDGLKIPNMPSVRNQASEAGKKLLRLQIRVLGTTTKAPYDALCHKCEEREGNRDAFPDFRARSNVLVPHKNNRVLLAFTLACYSKRRKSPNSEYRCVVHRQINGVLMRQFQSRSHSKWGGRTEQPLIRYELPYCFNIVAKLSPRTRIQAEDVDTADAVFTRSKMVAWSLYRHDIRARNPTMQAMILWTN